MTVVEENRPFAQQLSNVYFTILSLFCFKLFVKISLAILSHFYIVKGNRKEAARIAAEFYGIPQGQGSWADRSPLHEAASQGRLLSLKTLIAQGYNVDALTIDQVTPLHEACLGDHVGCARILLEAGANVNATTIDGITPLFNACSRGSASCVQLLLEYGAKIQWETCFPSPTHEAASRGANVQKGKFLETPLHAAARLPNTEIVNILLEFGADINAKNSEFERPVDVAVSSSLVEKILLLHEVTPCSLCQLCRLRIRNYIGKSRLHLVPQLQLPNILKNFLQYQ
ncbi:ankyrin repeat and SOCS box protein 5 isoform X4 [Pantherophis guttatus]|uniref:Ankyrin repeat and SOCS box protein 5 isoform X4 n=1 Tax=Pantherophis guttatus TaxID=94885 RepID=A0A6P9DSE1_PANGU|nr:ankyrin repeat and SOCS box protein 5 isoform X4 [Pantherophis guttatus]